MIQSASLFTFEIDDPDAACRDITRQLAEKLRLKKNTAAIMQCDPEYAESGISQRICEALSFPVVGSTAIAQATGGACGAFMLTLLVFTSDDVEFVAVRTEGHSDDFHGSVERSSAAAVCDLPLKLILAHPPLIDRNSGDDYIDAFRRVYGSVPVFGALAIEEELVGNTRSATVYNGEIFHDEMAYLLVFGNVEPRFFVPGIPPKSNLLEAGIITKSSGSVVYEINGMRAIDFFERLSLANDGVPSEGIFHIPFRLSVKMADGNMSPAFARGIYGFDEDGAALCRGAMPEGAVLTIGSNTESELLAGATEAVRKINALDDISAALFYSCIVRRTSFGYNPHIELEAVRTVIRPGIPFMMSYVGGEIGPITVDDDAYENCFHNFSFIACVLQ